MHAKPRAAAPNSCRPWDWMARSCRTGRARSGAAASLARWERDPTAAQVKGSGIPSTPPGQIASGNGRMRPSIAT
eukprot:12885896-Prorocentrum_lima.AAC.1